MSSRHCFVSILSLSQLHHLSFNLSYNILYKLFFAIYIIVIVAKSIPCFLFYNLCSYNHRCIWSSLVMLMYPNSGIYQMYSWCYKYVWYILLIWQWVVNKAGKLVTPFYSAAQIFKRHYNKRKSIKSNMKQIRFLCGFQILKINLVCGERWFHVVEFEIQKVVVTYYLSLITHISSREILFFSCLEYFRSYKITYNLYNEYCYILEVNQ